MVSKVLEWDVPLLVSPRCSIKLSGAGRNATILTTQWDITADDIGAQRFGWLRICWQFFRNIVDYGEKSRRGNSSFERIIRATWRLITCKSLQWRYNFVSLFGLAMITSLVVNFPLSFNFCSVVPVERLWLTFLISWIDQSLIHSSRVIPNVTLKHVSQ